jgi:uncharacterized membrane protein YgdD (TMEM256/DUF423 family)
MVRVFWILGSALAMAAVAIGAFAAHALKDRLAADMLATFEIGARYQMYHALALLAVAWAAKEWPGALTAAAGCLFVAGIGFFSGSLYLLAFGGPRWLGAIAPIGGAAFLAGWACLALAARQR